MRKVQHIKSCSTGKSRALRGISHEFSVELLLVSTLRVKHPCMNNAFLTLFVLWSYPMWQTRSCTITKRRVLSWSWTAWPKITVVSHKYAPSFATLALVQNSGGGLIRGMRQFLLWLCPPFRLSEVWPHFGGGGRDQVWGREMLPTLAVGCDELQHWVARKQGASAK